MTDPLYDRFRTYLYSDEGLGLSVDVSRIRFPDGYFAQMEPRMQAAFRAMAALEAGGIANPDEGRRVGHYWLRAADLAPDAATRDAITGTLGQIHAFARSVHHGSLRPQRASRFEDVLVIGIGGSALGPEFVAAALGSPADRMRPHFLDNTDPDGIDRVFDAIGDRLPRTLTVVISQERRHKGDAQRHAGGRRRSTSGGGSPSASTRSP